MLFNSRLENNLARDEGRLMRRTNPHLIGSILLSLKALTLTAGESSMRGSVSHGLSLWWSAWDSAAAWRCPSLRRRGSDKTMYPAELSRGELSWYQRNDTCDTWYLCWCPKKRRPWVSPSWVPKSGPLNNTVVSQDAYHRNDSRLERRR